MKQIIRKSHSHPMSLGDLVVAVSSCTRKPLERAAAVNDLLERGRVKLVPRRAHARSGH